jgi:hypothetical protein
VRRHTSPPTTFYQQHINLLSSDIGVLGSPKIRLGYIGGDTKGSSCYRTTRHQQQSNLPYSGSHTFPLRTSSTCTTIKLGITFPQTRRFWSKTFSQLELGWHGLGWKHQALPSSSTMIHSV